MTPHQLAAPGTEAAHQTALFAWAAFAHVHGFAKAEAWALGQLVAGEVLTQPKKAALPPLRWLHSIHNQGHGDRVRGSRAKAQGVRKGVADLFLPWPSAGCHGLYIEMKKPSVKPKRETSKGGVKDEQTAFGQFVKSAGFGWVACYSWEEAASIIRMYMEWNKAISGD